MYEAVPVTSIKYVNVPCGVSHWNGCSNRSTGQIEIKRGLSPVLSNCVLTHELHELAGYSHEAESPNSKFATDCGDGTLVPG